MQLKAILLGFTMMTSFSANAADTVLNDVIIKTYSTQESKEVCLTDAKELVFWLKNDYFKIENYRCNSRSSQLILIADFKIDYTVNLTKPFVIREFNSNFYHAPEYSQAMNNCHDDKAYYESFNTGAITFRADCAYSQDYKNNPQEWGNPTMKLEIIFKP